MKQAPTALEPIAAPAALSSLKPSHPEASPQIKKAEPEKASAFSVDAAPDKQQEPPKGGNPVFKSRVLRLANMVCTLFSSLIGNGVLH